MDGREVRPEFVISRRLRAYSGQIDPFDGDKSVWPARRGAKRDAVASGKLRNDADGPICPTGCDIGIIGKDKYAGQFCLLQALHLACDTGHHHARRASSGAKIAPVKWLYLAGTCSS